MSETNDSTQKICQFPNECICQYILNGKSVNFSGMKLEKNNTKQIYIDKMANVQDRELKNFTIHHFELKAKVGNEKKSCHLYKTPVSNGKPFERRHFLKLYFGGKVPRHVINEILRAGLKVVENGSKSAKFEFFGHSASQKREGICVLYDTVLGSWNNILERFGQFRKLKTVAKFSARIGLLLSSTIGGVEIDKKCVLPIDDVERNGYCFTDGCGLISVDLAMELARELRLSHCPSVFQIRLKGCKGVVALDPNLKGRQILIRKSMEKFMWIPPAPYHLGVVDNGFSRPYTYGHLNKQFIYLLSGNGIKDNVFLELQEKHFQELDSLEFEPNLALKYLCVYEKWKLAEKITRTGQIDDEIKNALNSIRTRTKTHRKYDDDGKNELKDKVEVPEAKKLKIPVWQSRLLFGVCDHTNTLKSGEIFVRVTENGQPVTLQDGTFVAVMRSPSYSAGDCRRLKCRDVQSLHSLVDCIVFPTQGDRPHPDEMSGGDLDGDTFFVCWEPRLVPKSVQRPTKYEGGQEKVCSGPITQNDCIESFANYDRFIVGTMSKLFDRWADSNVLGINCDQCKILNQKFSAAIDTAKTGINVTIGDSKNVPEPLQGANKNVWSKLEDKAELYLKDQLDFKPESVKCMEINDFLEFIENAPASLSEFQKFRLAYLFCKQFDGSNELEQICRFIDFNSFSLIQKKLLPVDLNFSLKNVSNQLYKSKILSEKDVDRFIDKSDVYAWSLYYKGYDDICINWNVLRNVLQSSMKKLIILKYCVDGCRSWAIAMYLTENLSLEGKEVMKEWTNPAQIHFFELGGHESKHERWREETQMTHKNWLIELGKRKRFEIYDGVRGRTFICIQEDLTGETVSSISVDQVGISRTDPRKLRKEPCIGCEIFVQYPSFEIAPILLQQKFANEKIDEDYDLKKFELNDEDIQDFLYNVDDFPNVDRLSATEVVVEADNPLKSAEKILQMYKLEPEIVQKNISILYQTMNANQQISDALAARLVTYLWKHEHRLEGPLQYLRVLISVMRGSCSEEGWLWLLFVQQNRTDVFNPRDVVLCRIDQLMKSMISAGFKFTVTQVKVIFHSILTTMNNRHSTVETMVYVLSYFKKSLLLPIDESPFRGENYFLYFGSLITMENLHELYETTVQAEDKRKTDQILRALASSSDNSKNDPSGDATVKNERTSNPRCVYKLSFVENIGGVFKIGSAVNLCPAKENEERPKFQMGFIAEIIKIRTSENALVVRGSFPDPHPLDQILTQKSFRVDPITNLEPYRRAMDALEFLCYSTPDYDVPPVMAHLIRSFDKQDSCDESESLPADVVDDDVKTKIRRERCNLSQIEAIESAICHEISLVQGPPGTGKTKTAALIVKFWIETGHFPILCVAETNEAVNNLCLKLIEEGLGTEIVRVGGSSSNLTESLKEISLEEIYTKRYPSTSNFVLREEYLDNKKVEHILREKKIVAVTCKAAGRDSLSLCDKRFENRKLFKAILVDEAAQVVEPAVIIPLSQSYCERLCLIGDDKQLPPLIKLKEAKQLSESLFERLHKTNMFHHVMLNVQYRMHPTISDFAKNKFYFGLTDGVGQDDRPLVTGFEWPEKQPMCFVEVPSGKEEVNVKMSKKNEKEAEILVEVLSKILDANEAAPISIGIITPYAAQEELIKDMLKAKHLLGVRIDVSTVDGFQGQERDLIIVSMVRNRDHIGFLDDERRTNVLLTRSKRGLIVFGREKTLSLIPIWKEWFDWVNKDMVHEQSANQPGNSNRGNRGRSANFGRGRHMHSSRGYSLFVNHH